ncbi:molybdenum cofactor sulfurase-like [Magnolia sinica]|uniref:molybdenum cofactor sulfurase-like n=1 Tax=Magnolia sinica TaxID=86752 RepID=UPI0026599932|nr:molybdenum cofactor sulfurase-like [Magnolia sinica]
MFSKFSLRSKGIRSQKEKNSRYGQINSTLPTDKDDYNRKENQSYSASTSVSQSEQKISLNSEVSTPLAHVADRNLTSLSSFGWFSTHDSKQSQRASSATSDDIGIETYVLVPYEDAEEQFLQENEGYFMHLSVDNVRKDQYPKLELERLVYLDHATCPLYSHFQVEQHMQIILEQDGPYLGTISAVNNPSTDCNTYIDETSKRLLDLFNATQDDYTVIFTPGLASCYRLFGDMHPFQKGSLLLISPDAHEFVRYVANASVQRGAKTEPMPLRKTDLCVNTNAMHQLLTTRGWTGFGNGLLIYPVQSCSSGMRHSLNWIVEAHQNGWKVLLDVASCLPTVNADLSLYQPEFVVGSLHHILGYPSDVGFLLVRRSSHSICSQRGTARLKIAEAPEHGKCVHVVTEGESLSIHTFAALKFGLEHLETVGFSAMQDRVQSLFAWLVKTLKSLKHQADEKPLVQMYGSLDLKYRGSILVFNILDSTGNAFPAGLVQRLAERNNIFLGICCFSNPELSLLLHPKSGRRTGRAGKDASTFQLSAVRLSLGPVSTFEDVYRLAEFLTHFGDEDYTSSEAVGYVEEHIQYC